MSDIDTLAATVLKAHADAMVALAADVHPYSQSAVDAHERTLADTVRALVEHARTLERERDEALQANEGKANLILHDALIARADRYEKAIRHVISDSPGTPDSVKRYLRGKLYEDGAALAGEDA